MTPHWSIYIIIRMSEGSRKLWKGHGVSGIKITESGKLGKPKTLGSAANFAQFLQPYAYVWSCVLVGLSGMYTQIEFRLVIMKIQMPAATWLEKPKCHPNYFKEGKWKPFAISCACVCRRMFALLLFKEVVLGFGSLLLPNFLTMHIKKQN